MHPLSRFSADEWPWEPGYSLAADIQSLGTTRRDLMRGLDQTSRQRFDPAMLYDKNGGVEPQDDGAVRSLRRACASRR